MTNQSIAPPGPRNGEAGKSLKDQNRWQLWIIVATNSLFLYGVIQANAIRVEGLRAVFTDAQNLIPVGVALVVATVLNGLVSADMKARLVFLRWHHALPGHRAFSEHATRDARIDLSVLETTLGTAFPDDPVEQNRVWYRIYKTMDNDPAVRQVHRDFLLLRDYTGLCALFIVFYGIVGLYAIPSWKIGLAYSLVLLLQFALVRQSASNYGIRMVTTVLARRAAKEPSVQKPPTKKRTPLKPGADISPDPKQRGA
jgi:hypothetical protein